MKKQNNLFANAIDRKALKKAFSNPQAKKEILNILSKIKYWGFKTMKRNKHITINLTDDQFNALQFIANNQNRKIADISYLLLLENINKYMLLLVDKKTTFEKLKY